MLRCGDAGDHKAAPKYKNRAYTMPERAVKFHNAQTENKNKPKTPNKPKKE